MGLQERVYQVLIVSASERFHTFWKELLPKSGFFPVCTVSSVSAAKRRLAEQAFDLVILNSPLPDEPGLRLAVDACAGPGTVVLLLSLRSSMPRPMIRWRPTACLPCPSLLPDRQSSKLWIG